MSARARCGLMLVAAAQLLRTAPAAAQPATPDSLRLGALQRAAVAHDPRAAQLRLLAAQSSLRLRNLGAEWFPELSGQAQAQYQSVVFTIPVQMPGVSVPTPPHDTYDAHLDARQNIYDATIRAGRRVERAQLAEAQAQVRTTLFALRQNVNEAFFTALRMQAQIAELEAGIIDLEAQLTVAEERVQAGTALQSEAMLLEATLLERRQSVEELAANRAAALVVLGELTGRTITSAAQLRLPALGEETERVRGGVGRLRERPEYEQFARSREALAQQRAQLSAQLLPRLSLYARGGYGLPGPNPFHKGIQGYWLGGLQLDWAPWNWGTTARQREELTLQQAIVASNEAAFTEQLLRDLAQDLASIDRLEAALASDEQIIALRERILRETRFRYGEAVITSAEYVDRATDLLAARLTRAAHQVELAQTQAHLITSLGLAIP